MTDFSADEIFKRLEVMDNPRKRAEKSAESGARKPWHALLLLTNTKSPRPLLANAVIALREAEEWKATLRYDEFSLETKIRRAPPWIDDPKDYAERAWNASDDLMLANWLQHEGICVQPKVAAQAVEIVARDVPFHPVKDYLDGLEHDGKSRADTWLSRIFGAEQTPYTAEIGRAILIGAVARIYRPGCKVDTVPIFEGEQGARKSTAIKALFNPWFTDELADLGSKDASMQVRGVWGVELAELDAMSRGELSKIKAFITRTIDRFRPPYGERLIESPRSCVFWGSTNKDDYLKDETGGRRFWPIATGKINIALLTAERDQLWAEAVVLYNKGVSWWITTAEIQADAEQQQRDRYVGDPWQDKIGDFLTTKQETSVADVLHLCLGVEVGRWGQAEMNRVSRCLQFYKWKRKRATTGAREWKYVKPDAPALRVVEGGRK
jgi:predicted P-loop ATPase